MRPVKSKDDARRSLRAGILALGVIALPASGWCGEIGAERGETGGVGLTSSRGSDAFASGGSSYGWNAEDVTESFGSLSQQEQARVLRRCRAVVEKPAEAEPNHLTFCQILAAIVRR
jgi:hypothetical protein